MRILKLVFISVILFSCSENGIKNNVSNMDSSKLGYWSKVMHEDTSNSTLNAFSFEDKYKIIEYAFNKVGINSTVPFEGIKNQVLNESPWDEIFNEDMKINRMSYWIIGIWGSYIYDKDKSKYVKPCDQIWYYDGEQDEIDYQKYVGILNEMRDAKQGFENWKEEYEEDSGQFRIIFNKGNKGIEWNIYNRGQWINGLVFKFYTELCQSEYLKIGNYYIKMEGQGGYIMFLSNEAEEYLRTLWDIPRINRRGKLMTLLNYGKIYDKK